jgi:rubredoxin
MDLSINPDDSTGDTELLSRFPPEVLANLSRFRPGDQTECPMCKAEFAVPDMRERDDNPATMDYHCPACGYCFAANWPKTKTIEEIVAESQHD